MTSPSHRVLVRLAAVAAALSLVLAVAGFRHVVPEEFALLGLALFVAFLVLIALLAWETRRTILAQRDAVERGQMIVHHGGPAQGRGGRHAGGDGPARWAGRRSGCAYSSGEGGAPAAQCRADRLSTLQRQHLSLPVDRHVLLSLYREPAHPQ